MNLYSLKIICSKALDFLDQLSMHGRDNVNIFFLLILIFHNIHLCTAQVRHANPIMVSLVARLVLGSDCLTAPFFNYFSLHWIELFQ